MAKILVVEDEVLLVEMLKMRLEQGGHEVIHAENGKEGLLKAMVDKPELIIADIMMPEMDGFEMIKVIRQNSDLVNTPIICVSALGRDSDVSKAMEVGANDYLVKPYSYEELLEKIGALLKK